MGPHRLFVFAGLPGTGKTTLARRLSRHRSACYLRVDAVEAALARADVEVGVNGYLVVHELAVSNLLLGQDVVVDAVNPVPESRAGWREAATRGGAGLVLFETVLHDPAEHRRRVTHREADLPGHVLPTWAHVQGMSWTPWDEHRDGRRFVVDTADFDTAWAAVAAVVQGGLSG